ncbi:MAG: family 20 glycosylhydrolase [Bacteroidota bacterium]|nr:family 20 glycosylhydrolase [Bacteroidota bacterium]
MKKVLPVILLLGISCAAFSQRTAKKNIYLIPQPVSILQGEGSFTLPYQLIIVTTGNKELKKIAQQLAGRLSLVRGHPVTIKEAKAALPKSIFLSLSADHSIPKEGYRLKVTPAAVSLTAAEPAGIFYGIQTLYQLLPGEILSKTLADVKQWTIPAVTIEDYPRFGWRGILLDVVRHWFTKQQVKDFIDDMVQFKFNVLHLHLTDDQGWRLEIKSLPKLTEVGAWRAPRIGRWGEFTKPAPDEPKTYGGFYTQDDMRELIQYAKERYVTILPEIDVPGHSLAAVASYPELTCTTDSTYEVNAGNRFMIWPGNGTFYGLLDNTLCPANEKVYEFLDKVFTEVARLFPCPYIHMGGDECYKGYWEKSEACKQLMQKEGLKDMHELQSYFVKRVSAIISSKGKKMMGWDEIMDGGLADSAVVMSWQGMKGGTAAAAVKHAVVMSPNDYAYVDLYQGDPVAEPPTYSMLRLSKSYQFDPLPPGVDSQYILGGQCNLWSERLYTMRHAQYMLWPRGLAIAESVWSPKGKKNWNDFVHRVENQFHRFDIEEIKYSRSLYDPIFTAVKDSSGQLQIVLSTEIEGLTIYYSFDETYPDNFYPAYRAPLSVPKDAANLKVVTYRGKEQMGKIINMPIAELKKRAKIN